MDISNDDPLQIFKSLEAEEGGAGQFSYGPLEDFESLDQFSASSDVEEQATAEDPLEDLWSGREILEPAVRQVEIESWERSHAKSFKQPCIPYISESGPRVFDAALDFDLAVDVNDASGDQPAPPLRSEAVLSSLMQLALGRESLLFHYDEKENKFQSVVGNLRVSGYTMECFHSALISFICYGNQLRQAKGFVRITHSSTRTTAASVALASGIETIITALETHLSGRLASVQTILQLQAMLDPSRVLLDCLSSIIGKARKLENNDTLVSMLFDIVQDFECSSPWLHTIMAQLLAYASGPWLESVEHLVGLRMSNTNTFTNTGADNDENPSRKMPEFIHSEIAECLLEAEQSLKLLQTHEPDHLLARQHPSSDLPSLQLQFSWQDIEKVQARARKYESDILQALYEYNTSGTLHLLQPYSIGVEPHPLSSNSETQTCFTDLIQIDSSLPTLFTPPPSTLSTTVIQAISNIHQHRNPLATPPISLLPTLSFRPLLAAQSRLLSRSTLRLLFHTNSLRSHLRLLRSYSLFANGPFLVRLSHALLDPSLPSAASRKGRIRASGITGLQLGASEMAWPPASSELRIALMGILTESYQDSHHGKDRNERGRDNSELPGSLSFAIRHDMSDAELEKCMNKDGLEALDFLKIQYRPPKPLHVVITESALERYDRLSRLLLRGARLMFVVKSLMLHPLERMRERKACGLQQRFKIEAHHFVTTVFGYFADSIKELWVAFENRLDGIERSIDCYDVGREVEGVHRLRDLHEEVLDGMLAACLLRKRQELVMRLLEDILGLILAFAKVERGDDNGNGKEGEVSRLYQAFRKKVRVFITVCRGLQDQKSVAQRKDLFHGGQRGEDRGNGIGSLVLGLEMSGWYMR